LCEPEETELRERLANAERLVRVDTALARRVSESIAENSRLRARIAELEKTSCHDEQMLR
jgi:hypothetical protein